MFSQDLWREIFQSIRKNKLRTALSGFTITFAILIFTLLFGIANGLKNTFASFFVGASDNAIFIWTGKTTEAYKGNKIGKQIKLKNTDYDFVKENYDNEVQYITSRIHKNFTASYQGKRGNYKVRGTHPDFQFIEIINVIYGRFLNVSDIHNKLKIVVIGKLVAEDLFGTKNPIGKYIHLQNIAFKVVGVFEDDGGDNDNRLIYMPVSTIQNVFSNDARYIDEISLSYNPKMNYDEALSFGNAILKTLKEKLSVSPKDQRAIRIYNMADGKKGTDQIIFVLGIIIFFIGFGTLIAGVIGISNIMVYIVKERSKELGIRKVLGASPNNIIQIILLESILITTLAGYLGIFIGMGAISLIDDSLKDYFITDPNVEMNIVISATIILIIAGSFAGYIPAKKAANIKPIVALRDGD